VPKGEIGMRGVRESILVGIVLGGIIGCGADKRLPEERILRQAPTSETSAGILVSGAQESDLLTILENHPNTKVRVLSAKNGFYEVFGLSLEEVKQKLPEAKRVEANQFINRPLQALQTDAHPNPLHAFRRNDLFDEFVSSCTEIKSDPAPFMYVANKEEESQLDSYFYNLGDKLDFKIAPLEKINLNYATILQIPELSKLSQAPQLGSELSFTPDQVGVYGLFTVGKNPYGVCHIIRANIFITANPTYNKSHALSDEEKRLFDFSPFWHLEFILDKISKLNTYTEKIKIAIIDTGVNYNHPLLADRIAINDKEIPFNGIDDDGNGYVDDYIGYDFSNNDHLPYDDDGHGSHVAGLSGSLIGIHPDAEILPVKALRSIGFDVGSVTAAIYYAVDQGADIINASFGWTDNYAVFKDAVLYAKANDVLIVCASGNGNEFGLGIDIDQKPLYPASYNFNNIITVTSLNENQELADYANFGKNSVHLAALGGTHINPLLSLATANASYRAYHFQVGTSMATGIASGALAKIMSQNKITKKHRKRDHLLRYLPVKNSLKSKTLSGHIVDLRNALPSLLKARP
jgi:subtilisin family serine protease